MSPRHLVIALAFALSFGGPAGAITKQAAPTNSDGSSRLVDPDARADAMTDSAQRSTRRSYERALRSNRNLVAPSGPAAGATFGSVFAPR